MPLRRTPLLTALLAAALAARGPAVLRAQDQAARDTAARDATRDTVPRETPGGCPRIRNIFVDNNSVFLTADPSLDPRFRRAYRLANRFHVRTREAVIRRELLFREGDCYQPFLLEDSERILRATGYLADAEVFAVRQPDGAYDVIVETRDEWSTRLEAAAGSGEVTGVQLREDNLAGRGGRVAAFWREQQGERVYGVRVGTPQLFGTHVDAEASLAKTPVGVSASERVSLPFRGEGAHWAWREAFVRDERNFEYFVPLSGSLQRRLFPVLRTAWDVGAVRRLGRRGHLTLLGGVLAGERRAFPQDTLTALPADSAGLPGDGFVPGLQPVSNVRAVLLAGRRDVVYDRRRGLDAVRGAEDVALGFDVEAALGRTVAAWSSDDDVALDLGVQAQHDLPGNVLGGFKMELEGKRELDRPAGPRGWRDLLGQVDAWTYWKPSGDSRHTLVMAARGASGWNLRVPFQLTLGYRAGLRGYPRQVYAGRRRFVATFEHRAYLAWPYPRLFDLGSALFVDAGKTWAAGDPFGQDSPLLVSAGAGLRLAFPPRSRQTYRLDLAFPVAPTFRPRGIQVSIGIGQAVGRTAADVDPQIARSSRRPVDTSLFDYPGGG